MAPKRDLDALEDGGLCFSMDRLTTKRSKFAGLSSNNEHVKACIHNVDNSPIYQPSIQSLSPSKSQPKKRSFEDLEDDDSKDVRILSKRFKLLLSYQEKEFLPIDSDNRHAEVQSNHIWCTKIAEEITAYVPPSPATDSDDSSSSWSTYSNDESNSEPSKEPFSDDTYDEYTMDVDAVLSGVYDPTEGIYDAILEPKTKDGTFEVMRQRTLEILQIMDTERSKKYPSLWLRSLCQILHAVVIAAERACICWQLTPTETEDLRKIAKVMEDIASIMPDWNKPNYPVKLLLNVNVRFMTGGARLGVPNLLDRVISYFRTGPH